MAAVSVINSNRQFSVPSSCVSVEASAAVPVSAGAWTAGEGSALAVRSAFSGKPFWRCVLCAECNFVCKRKDFDAFCTGGHLLLYAGVSENPEG